MITLMLAEGENPRLISELAGHATVGFCFGPICSRPSKDGNASGSKDAADFGYTGVVTQSLATLWLNFDRFEACYYRKKP